MVAHKILLAMAKDGGTLDEASDAAPELSRLEPRDRALTRLILLTTLRQMGFLDARLKQYATRMEKLPADALMAMRIGLAQLLFLETPPHAAINACVNVLKPGDKVMRGVVNAVLRKCVNHEKPPAPDTTWPLAIPRWLLQAWDKDYGTAQTAEIAAASLREAALDITVKENPELWREKLNATLLPTGSLRLKSREDVKSLPGFAEGAWWVQNAAAAIPARLAGDVKGKFVYDLCAAPGGKTAQFLAAGAKVVAIDQSEKRLQRLSENLKRLNLQAEVVCADVLKFKPGALADVVLLDAPCSATGTLRRHPDLMLNKNAADIPRLAMLQQQLLQHAAGLVQTGGLLIYATCSLQQAEGEGVIEAFLAKNPGFQRAPIDAGETGHWQEGVTKSGDLRTLPCMMKEHGGMDGFFAARLKKNEVTH